MTLRPRRLRCDHRSDPLDVAGGHPWLSWAVDGNAVPAGARVLVASTPAGLDRPDLWDSGSLDGGSGAVRYAGAPLGSRQRCAWTVAVTDSAGHTTVAAPATFEIGLRDDDWTAQWIGLPWDEPDADERPCPHLRTVFDVASPPASARLHITALGAFSAWIDGVDVSADRLAPGWHDYRHRVPSRTYDVTALVGPGRHTLAVLLGEAWWSGHIGLRAIPNRYGARPHLRAQLEIVAPDGAVRVIGTDGSWRAAFGAQRRSDLLLGERSDWRLEPERWREADFDDAAWRPAVVDSPDVGPLEPAGKPPVRVTAELRPVGAVARTASRRIVDLGQNAAGWVRLDVTGPAGAEVVLRHGEALEPDGSLHRANLRQAEAEDRHVLRGGAQRLEPAFTTHGFRYAEITADEGVEVVDVTGVVAHSDLDATGSFSCSDDLVNRIFSTIKWSQRSNAVEIPTDCPQRDERLGWLGDAYVFGPTAVFNFDVAAWLGRWYDDVLDAQGEDGSFPDVAPLIDAPDLALAEGAPGWGDAGVTLPWLLHVWYGNPQLLERAYPAARRWVELVATTNPGGLWRHRRGNDFGDWLGYEVTDREMLATAISWHSATTLTRMAAALGHADAAREHLALADRIRGAFAAAYVGDDGRVANGTQTAQAVALRYGLVPGRLRSAAARRLVDDLERWGQMTVGYLGVANLLPALTQTGYVELAYELVTGDEVPSWGHQIRSGATTFWERWDGWTVDRGLHDPILNSLNHVTLGSVGEWLRGTVAGLDADPDRPGFAGIRFAPRPGGSLTAARARLDSVRGTVACGWERDGSDVEIALTVPATSSATVVVPAGADDRVVLDGHDVSGAGPRPRLQLGPGEHRLTVRRSGR